jgi:uncharacterized coiled-coil DUF342 family protein
MKQITNNKSLEELVGMVDAVKAAAEELRNSIAELTGRYDYFKEEVPVREQLRDLDRSISLLDQVVNI